VETGFTEVQHFPPSLVWGLTTTAGDDDDSARRWALGKEACSVHEAGRRHPDCQRAQAQPCSAEPDHGGHHAKGKLAACALDAGRGSNLVASRSKRTGTKLGVQPSQRRSCAVRSTTCGQCWWALRRWARRPITSSFATVRPRGFRRASPPLHCALHALPSPLRCSQILGLLLERARITLTPRQFKRIEDFAIGMQTLVLHHLLYRLPTFSGLPEERKWIIHQCNMWVALSDFCGRCLICRAGTPTRKDCWSAWTFTVR